MRLLSLILVSVLILACTSLKLPAPDEAEPVLLIPFESDPGTFIKYELGIDGSWDGSEPAQAEPRGGSAHRPRR